MFPHLISYLVSFARQFSVSICIFCRTELFPGREGPCLLHPWVPRSRCSVQAGAAWSPPHPFYLTQSSSPPQVCWPAIPGSHTVISLITQCVNPLLQNLNSPVCTAFKVQSTGFATTRPIPTTLYSFSLTVFSLLQNLILWKIMFCHVI